VDSSLSRLSRLSISFSLSFSFTGLDMMVEWKFVGLCGHSSTVQDRRLIGFIW